MKTITKYILGLALVAGLTGCKDKMRELNTNPDTIGNTQPEYMFTNATWQWMHNTRDMISTSYSSVGQLMQYYVYYTYSRTPYANPTSGTYPNIGPFSNYWGRYYSDQVGNKLDALVKYIDEQLPENEQPWYNDIKAISKVLQTYYLWQLFDVYGAAVYNDAFKYAEGVMTPEYDMIWDVYKELDATIKEQIAVLSQGTTEHTVKLNQYDFFYGWKSVATPGGGSSVSRVDDYAIQRANWLKMANVFRLKMALRFKAQDAQHFNTVLAEVTANPENLFTSIDEGCYYHMDDEYLKNSDDVSEISMYYYLTDNFVTHLKTTGDPRLPLLARPNSMDPSLSTGYTWLQKFAPDSLATKKVWNYQTNTLEVKPWGEITEEGNVYQGMSANPAQDNVGTTPGQLLATRNVEIAIRGPYYDPTDPSKETPSWTITAQDGSGDVMTIYGQDTTIYLRGASPAQGRYLIRSGGKNTGTSQSGGNGGDGPAEDWTIKMRRPVLTYVEQCLMMAYIAADNNSSVAGKTLDEWYRLAVENAIDELQQDAWRYKIQIATNPDHARIPTVNPNGVYEITSGMVQTYLNNNLLGSNPIEQIAAQAWVYFYTNPQEMWGWWKLTGYPRIAKVFTPAQRKDYPYLMQPYATEAGSLNATAETNTMLDFPRRNTLPQPNTANNANYLQARTTLVGQTNPPYGAFGETTGRIWWDTKAPAPAQ